MNLYALLLGASLPLVPPTRPLLPPATVPLTVVVTQLPSPSAPVLVGFYDAATAAHYPDPTKYLFRQVARPAGATQVSVHAEVAAGTWAVAVYQDLNGNGQLDTNLVGQPKEPYAFSNDLRPTWRAPRFSEGTVLVNSPGRTLHLTMMQP